MILGSIPSELIGGTEHHGSGSIWQMLVVRKQRGYGETVDKIQPPKTRPQWPAFLLQLGHLLKFLEPPRKMTLAGDQALST